MLVNRLRLAVCMCVSCSCVIVLPQGSAAVTCVRRSRVCGGHVCAAVTCVWWSHVCMSDCLFLLRPLSCCLWASEITVLSVLKVIQLDSCLKLCHVGSLNLKELCLASPWKVLEKSLNLMSKELWAPWTWLCHHYHHILFLSHGGTSGFNHYNRNRNSEQSGC